MDREPGVPGEWDPLDESTFDSAVSWPMVPRGGEAAIELGHGAHGVVVEGDDRHLPRLVAWKVARGKAGRERLRRESEILAELDHPSIVTVFDLHEGHDDSLRMALRVVRGKTLKALVAERAGAARMKLLRPFLHAAQAVGFAHERGFVHRDIKPANIMIGEHGETQVIDWGLALRLDEATPPGEVVGTPAAMSPEQARGEAVDERADVWGLGATLFEIVAGRPPRELAGLSRDEVLARLRTGARDRLADVAPGCPPALAAIVERCLAPDPDDRYRDARALAEDLGRYLDGGIVQAHDYSALEVLKRFLRTWRLALFVIAAVLVTGVVAALLALGEIAGERDVARAARDEAVRALGERDHESARRAESEAARERADGQRAEAERAAARALELGESASARGVIAAVAIRPEPRRELLARPPFDCVDVAVAPDGTVACGDRERVAVVRGEHVLWRARVDHRGFVFSDGGRVLDLVDGTYALERRAVDGGAVVTRHPATGCLAGLRGDGRARATMLLGYACIERLVGPDARREPSMPCGADSIRSAAIAADGTVVVMCGHGRLRVIAPDGGAREVMTALGDTVDTFLRARVDDDAIVYGTSGGELLRVALADGAVTARWQSDRAAPIRDIAAGDGLVVARLEGRGAIVLDRRLALVEQMPRDDARMAELPGAGALVTYGREVVRWHLPGGARYGFDGFGGVTGLTPAGLHLVVVHDRAAEWVRLADGAREAAASWALAISKQAAVIDGEVRVARASAREGSAQTGQGDPTIRFRAIEAARRIAPLPDGRTLIGRTGPGLTIGSRDGDTQERASDAQVIDLAVVGAFAIVLADDAQRGREVSSWDLAGAPVMIDRRPASSALAVTLAPPGPGERLPEPLVVMPRALISLASGFEYALVGDELALATVTPNGRWVVLGTRAGRVHVFARDGGEVADVHLHDGPVTTLVADPDGRWVASGAWDGRVSFLATAAFDAPREGLAANVFDAWGR